MVVVSWCNLIWFITHFYNDLNIRYCLKVDESVTTVGKLRIVRTERQEMIADRDCAETALSGRLFLMCGAAAENLAKIMYKKHMRFRSLYQPWLADWQLSQWDTINEHFFIESLKQSKMLTICWEGMIVACWWLYPTVQKSCAIFSVYSLVQP